MNEFSVVAETMIASQGVVTIREFELGHISFTARNWIVIYVLGTVPCTARNSVVCGVCYPVETSPVS